MFNLIRYPIRCIKNEVKSYWDRDYIFDKCGFFIVRYSVLFVYLKLLQSFVVFQVLYKPHLNMFA